MIVNLSVGMVSIAQRDEDSTILTLVLCFEMMFAYCDSNDEANTERFLRAVCPIDFSWEATM
jgi:hypothetical protein